MRLMTETTDTPQEETPKASAASSAIPADSAMPGWLAGLPPSARPYVALSRLDRPVGIWLLALPCWIGLAFARIPSGLSWLDPLWVALFGIGAVAMRGAGCTWNDLRDRDLDSEVARTAGRPLPSGQVSVRNAWLWLGGQLFVGFLVWLFLPWDAKLVALLALPLVGAYPLMKRITWWPQAWLGLTFNWGVLVAYFTAGGETLPGTLLAIVLFAGMACWTIAYDTIYAIQDIEDDALVGIKSTARLFGDRTVLGAFSFHLTASAIIALAAVAVGAEQIGALTVLAFLGHGLWQSTQLRKNKQRNALAMFKSNVWAGTILLVGFTIAALLA